jgi:hypothetical protein
LENAARYAPNYSRFPGDKLGFLSEAARQGYGRYFWRQRNSEDEVYWSNIWFRPTSEAWTNNSEPASPFFLGPKTGDILAEAYLNDYFKDIPDPAATVKRMARDMRQTELATIAPDLFDVTYYAIEPRFNEYYLPRLQRMVATKNTKRPNLMVRGDLGWRAPGFPGESGLAADNANVEFQMNLFKNHDFFKSPLAQVFQNVTESEQLLTSWAEQSIVDYSAGNAQIRNKIASCNSKVPAGADSWLPGGCAMGGRTGYSVKLISKKFLKNEIPDIGGRGVIGPINNPPDDSF